MSSKKKPTPGEKDRAPPGALSDSVASAEYREQTPPLLCSDHLQPLDKYCETCEELVCPTCVIYGPHNTDEHWILGLEEAYQNRKLKLNFLVNRKLDDRKEAIQQRLKFLNQAREAIHEEKDGIELQTREYFAEMLSRLDGSAEPKLASLIAEAGNLQSEYRDIEALIFECQRATKEHPLFLLGNIKAFKDNINYFMSKQFNPEIEETPYDLPRELYCLRKTIEDADNHEILFKLKNKIIKSLLDQNFESEKKNRLKNDNNVEAEIAEWTQMSDLLAKRLKEITLVCHFCGEPLTQSSVNRPCLVNKKDNPSLRSTFQGFSSADLPLEEMGTGFHYFGPPRLEVLEDPQLMNIISSQALSRPSPESLYQEAMEFDVERLFNSLRRALARRERETGRPGGEILEEAFQGLDSTGLKVLQRPALEYALHETLGTPPQTVDELCRVMDPFGRDLINYAELIRLLLSPGKLEDLPYFKYARQPLADGFKNYQDKFQDFHQTLEARRKEEQERIDRQALQEEKERALRETQKAEQKAAGTGSRYASKASKVKAIGGKS